MNERDYEKYSDTELIDLFIQDKDEDAFEVLFRRHNDILNFYTLRTFLKDADAEDIRQVCNMAFLSAVRSFDPQKDASFRTYACVCIRNASGQLIRYSQAKKRVTDYTIVSYDDEYAVSDTELAYDGEESMGDGLFINEAMDVMRRILSENEYMAFMYSLMGYCYEDIACMKKLTRKQVDNAICRARKKLSDYYMNIYDGYSGD